MEKRGVIDENTPPEVTEKKSSCCNGRCPKPRVVGEKQAADQLEDHAATRAADAVKDAVKR